MSGAFAAEILERGARAFASFAANRVFEQQAAGGRSGESSGFLAWQDQLTQIVLDLGAAMRVDEPAVFVQQVEWLRQAFAVRGAPVEALAGALEALRSALQEELPSEVFSRVDPTLRAGMQAASRPAGGGAPGTLSPSDADSRLGLEYLQRLLSGDRRGAYAIALGAAEGGVPIRRLYLGTLVPALEEVGRLWHAGEISIAEEHFATDATQGLLAILASREHGASPNGKTVVVASAPGNTHDTAVRALSDFFEMDGWRSICLGADIPASEFGRAREAFEPDLVAISATMPAQLRGAADAIAAIRRAGPPTPRTLVGGRAFARAPDLWKKVGADAWAGGIEDACAVGRRLVGLPPA